MEEDIPPISKMISDKALMRATQNFIKKVFKSIERQAKPKIKAFTIREVDLTPLSYEEVKFDKEGWADASIYAPQRFDVVLLSVKTKEGKELQCNGWYKGGDWYSRKLGDKLKVLKWKMISDNFAGGPQDVW